jgi:putative inorganic carbon (HCO3(-)) transporter
VSANTVVLLPGQGRFRGGAFAIAFLLKAFYGLLRTPEYLFLAALAAMLFRPPDLLAFPIDRVAFATLVVVGLLSILFRRYRIHAYAVTWPMLALVLLGMWGALEQPYNAKTWSLLAAKWIVPFAMFHLGGPIFASPVSQRKLEWFAIIVLLYLGLTAVFFFLDLRPLIFPRFILDEGIGIHVDRARGPLLQAVANGVCLNIFGIIAFHAFAQRRLRGVLAAVLFAVTPLALLATKTRAVWLAAAVSTGAMALFGSRRPRRAARVLIVVSAGLFCVTQLLQTGATELRDRMQDRSPVEFRIEMYRAGWQMFTEKPFAGWGSDGEVQPEIAKRISSFHSELYVFHNTYLELAVQRGLLGLSLYAWLIVALFRLGGHAPGNGAMQVFGREFTFPWKLMLCVYLLNGSAVVMNYQFVNGFVFTIAGVLAWQKRTAGNRHFTTSGACNENCLSV